MPTLNVLRSNKDAFLPYKATEDAACMDLFACSPDNDIEITSGQISIVPTGIKVSFDKKYELQIRCRSGMAAKGIMLANGIGTIDADYRGEVGIILYNSTSQNYKIKHGDRIAQCCLKEVLHTDILEVNELDNTKRGTGGFGSTGK